MELLGRIEVEIANGKQAAEEAGVVSTCAETYERWRKEFGGLKLDQEKRWQRNPVRLVCKSRFQCD